ncbi:uncharacterized protein LOC125561840 isoform X2 [Nematostella vectensis]|uniref:uncharacterized protein LOC125561840 isoform X2 n=1 Tax=Nematostella vectensis TaxID=45351 RepID=UPI00207798A0|nr:uncharacterized protein LOC125561840 isoform X2 [Nematostella vectensis]
MSNFKPFVVAVLLAFLPFVFSEDCKRLDGFWYNQLGSEILLKHSNDGKLVGEYRTAVERQRGSSGGDHSIILGAAPLDSPGSTFAFAVVWKNGSSTTVWTAQCIKCSDGHEKILTSWLLRSQVDTCVDKWKSTMIGRDVFTRYEQVLGPRKQGIDPTSLPTISTDFKTLKFTPRSPCSLHGTWYNDVGSQMILKQDYEGIIVVWRGGASVTGWVGQCHICGSNKTEQIEASWLLKSKISSCDDNWKSTLYSESSFTMVGQKEGPRKELGTHTPNRDGEDDGKPCGSAVVMSVSYIMCAFVLALNNII